MVLGLRTKSRKTVSIQVDYLINVQEIKPWPRPESLKSAQQVLLHWENDDESSGSLTASIGDGNIEFRKAFRLTVNLCKEASKKSAAPEVYHKNCLEFNLYEVRKEKAKGQHLGSAIINLADYGIIRENKTINAPLNCKKSPKNSAQPVLYIDILSLDKVSSSSSPQGLSKEVFLDKTETESVSEPRNGADDAEVEIASFTDDEEDYSSSHSSRTITSNAPETTKYSPADGYKKVTEPARGSRESVGSESSVSLGITSGRNQIAEVSKHPNGSSSQTDSSARIVSDSSGFRSTQEASGRSCTSNKEHGGKSMPGASIVEAFEEGKKKDEKEVGQEESMLVRDKNMDENKTDQKPSSSVPRKQAKLRSDTLLSSRNLLGTQGTVPRNDKLRHLKSLQVNFDSSRGGGLFTTNQITQQSKKVDSSKVAETSAVSSISSENKGTGQVTGETSAVSSIRSENKGTGQVIGETKGINQTTEQEKPAFLKKANHNGRSSTSEDKGNIKDFPEESKAGLESKVEILQEELREAAAVEVALYSVVAEHGSSTSKVHAPARRLSRFYLHALKSKSSGTTAGAARTIVSGLVLVSKACGNDVPRLTFWLSNAVLLRAIVSHVARKSQHHTRQNIRSRAREDEWQKPQTLVVALENVEAWIFSRIVDCIWWQTLTPCMQSAAAAKGSSSRKSHGKRHGLGDQEQGNFSIDLWKKAFKDASERLCPLRAGGHECGCLPVLARLVMEQLVSRLDVAMFNAILREPEEEMPTDPVSDPITDRKVLPIPAGKSSFGAGAQLKNAVGNWSRWLTDLFGIDDGDTSGEADGIDRGNKKPERESSFKAFFLLNALSDLMMLPFEMLEEKSTRKELCPVFGAALIKRVLNNFVPDEFCPKPIPEAILEALDCEDPAGEDEQPVTSLPCLAAPTVYSPPPPSSFTSLIGEVGNQIFQRSGSSVLRKSYTSDDELDELDSPVTAIFSGKTQVSPTSTDFSGNRGRKAVRYQLLREIWKDNQ